MQSSMESPATHAQTELLNPSEKLKIGWVISNGRETASSRLQGYLIHEWLQANGYDSQLLLENFNSISSVNDPRFFKAVWHLFRSDRDLVVFEGGEWPMMQLARLWRRLGKHAVGVRCDRIPGQFNSSYDLTIVPTEQLRDALGIERAVVIEDSVEVAERQFKQDYAAGARLRVAWVGHQNYADYITALVHKLKEHPEINSGFEFELISKGEFATRQWSEHTVADDILACDVAMIPVPQGEWFQTKSTNRLALMMALGMPLVSTLIPSYKTLAREGENGLFVESEDAIAGALLSLRDPSVRERLGMNGRRTVAGRFSLAHIGPKWVAAFQQAARQTPLPVPGSIKWTLISRAFALATGRAFQ